MKNEIIRSFAKYDDENYTVLITHVHQDGNLTFTRMDRKEFKEWFYETNE